MSQSIRRGETHHGETHHVETPHGDTERGVARDAHGRATLWRAAGGLALGHVVLLLAGFSQEVAVDPGTPADGVRQLYAGADLGRVLLGGYVESVSFLVLAAAIVVVARAVGSRTAWGRSAATVFLVLGTAYIAATLAVGFPPGAAALYAAQHGADSTAVSIVNDVRNYGFVLQVALAAGMSLSLGVAALSDRVLVKWCGWLGVAVGVGGILTVPFAHNAVSIVWLLWWTGVAVLLLRGPRMPGGTGARGA